GVERGRDLVWTGLVAIEALADDGLPFGNEVAIPESTVLLSEQDEIAVRCRAGRTARLDQQHEREQAHDLRFAGHELDQEPSEPDCLSAQLIANQTVAGARRVTLVEDEGDDGEDSAEPTREGGLGRDRVWDPPARDLALGA